MSLSPFLRTPMTDLTGGMISHQLQGRCQKEEMRYMDCLEAYGLDRGETKCKALFEDYHECHTLTKQFKRFFVMRTEREKQISEGKLTGDKQYVTPKVDSY
ncbi:NADH dehydrogenase [ubiquinone] iron-sulfur protein 5-like [Cydia splendana]|uniref:NADH dehydrogenase [ubiquinone] iron-sulfur protein 5-like n=1 Tax=Cydia splendana TaxID=1100963 RepID=UPI002136A756